MEPIVFSLRLPTHMAGLPPALAFAVELAQGSGFDDAEIYRIRLALEEALTNVLSHGFAPGEQAFFELICERHAASLVFVIREKGQPFDPSRAPVYRPAASLGDFSSAGLGMFLLRQSMDEVAFRNLGRDGKELRLTKHMRHKRIDAQCTEADLARYDRQAAAAPVSASVPLAIRPLRPEEAIEVSRCAYKAYGYSYEDYIYYPDRIVEMNANGLMQSLVAVTAEGEIAGHIALKRHAEGDPIAESGVGFVKPEFRAHGIFIDLIRAAMVAAREAGFLGIFGRAVTSHAITQKTCRKLGYRACGLLLALFPSDVEFRQLTGHVIQKESSLLIFLPLHSREVREIHPPPQHRNLILGLYEALGIPVRTAEVKADPKLPERETELETAVIDVMNVADIRLMRYGADVPHAVQARLRAFCLEKRDVIFLYLDLEEAATASMTAVFENMGFFFAGILPSGLLGRDALILQYLNNIAIDYDRIALDSAGAARLLSYVRQCDRKGNP